MVTPFDTPKRDDDAAPEERVLSVSELTSLIKGTLETAFSSVWVAGEVTDIARPRSGHIYLTLKDNNAQLRGVLWRNSAARLKFDLQDGLEVFCRGDIDVYPPRGSYQIVIRQIEPQGQGAMQLALRQLQEKLAGEGLFDEDRKRPLPSFPRRIAFVTSPTGAAVRDFLEVARRRWSGAHVLVAPTKVQGEGAAEEIARAIAAVNRLRPAPDVLVVGRGGGSVEDLWSFNEEVVIRAIANSEIPVVSAVGHEIDVTLSDLVADVRALTPSEAAERVVPSAMEAKARLTQLHRRAAAALRAQLTAASARLDALARQRSLRLPLDRIHEWARRVDELQMRAARAIQQRVIHERQTAATLAAQLESLSPLAVLSRGYSITSSSDGKPLLRANDAAKGDRITTRLSQGLLVSRVEEIEAGEPANRQARKST